MGRGGKKSGGQEPERRCIATGESLPRARLVRFVVGPDDTLVPDVLGKLPGRGIWVRAERAALEKAVKRGLFARSARRAVRVPGDLIEQTERQLARHMIDLVALSRRAGEAVCGYEKVKRWLAEGRAKILLQAADGSARGKGKLWTPEGGRYFGMLSASELGLAFGRESVIHGALAAGGLSMRVVEEGTRLAGFRGIDGSEQPGR